MWWRGRAWLLGAVLGTVLAVTPRGPAVAHPHVFIDYVASLVVAGDRFQGIRLAWTFDDLFSGFILQEFDRDPNGTLSAAELQQIEAKHLSEFQRVGYHTTLAVNGNVAALGPARELRVTLAKGIVTYEFTLPVTGPPALSSTTAIEIVIDDPSYFIAYAVTSAAPASQVVGRHVVECRTAHDKSGITPDAVRCAIRRR
jgi:ABC-type uncharacterized transport system substrate-binding protein